MQRLKMFQKVRLVKAHLKLALKTSLEVRELRGAVFQTYKVSKDSPVVEVLQESGRAYSQAAQTAGRGHDLGGPAPHRAQALVLYLSASEAVPASTKEVLNRYEAARQTALTMAEVGEDVHHLKMMKRTYAGDLRGRARRSEGGIGSGVASVGSAAVGRTGAARRTGRLDPEGPRGAQRRLSRGCEIPPP